MERKSRPRASRSNNDAVSGRSRAGQQAGLTDQRIDNIANTNSVVAGILGDLAAIQSSKQSRWGYKRAAYSVLSLSEDLLTLVNQDGSLQKIPFVGPRSEAVIREVLLNGFSPTLEEAIDQSGKRTEIEQRRRLRGNFLNRAAVAAALKSSSLSGPKLADYRGDLQMHSIWSDGVMNLRDIVEAGLARGYTFSAVTDHSYGLRIARGVSMEDMHRQHAEIDSLNTEYRNRFRLIKGVEANIRADGGIDMTPVELASFELVVAAPHSALRTDKDQTTRMLSAVRTAGVHIIGHPRGRMYGSRPGVSADWNAVFSTAARLNVAIEIDGDPNRQDIDYQLAREALQIGCVFALDSDAHAADELANAEIAIAHARLAGIPPGRIINCWPTDQLLHWLADRHR